MLLLLLAMPASVFLLTWALMDGPAWGLVLAAATVVGGAVLGQSADLDELDA